MRVVGIVAEYDPFHNGHAHHLKAAREQAGADYLVCVLGGPFSQRGTPALFSTHDRARMALLGGADLVLGMPLSFSCAQANRFAAGGVGILCALGTVTHLSFGAEFPDAALLTELARALENPDAALREKLLSNLTEGQSFARAMGGALSQRFPHLPPPLLSAPNTVLAISYIRELLKRESGIRVLPIARRSAYHATAPSDLPSATAMRGALLRGDWQGVRRGVPKAVFAVLTALMEQGRFHPPRALDRALLYKIVENPPQRFSRCAEVSEGLERRVSAAAREVCDRADLIRAVKTKRYPYTRISRALTSMLLDIPSESLPSPPYARLLGFRRRALPLLRTAQKGSFPLVSRPARSGEDLSLDMRGEMLWYIGAGLPVAEAWRRQPIIIE